MFKEIHLKQESLKNACKIKKQHKKWGLLIYKIKVSIQIDFQVLYKRFKNLKFEIKCPIKSCVRSIV